MITEQRVLSTDNFSVALNDDATLVQFIRVPPIGVQHFTKSEWNAMLNELHMIGAHMAFIPVPKEVKSEGTD